MRGKRFLPPDPRPSKAHPEHRKLRKELEKEHGYEWLPPIILGLLGITLAFDVTKDVAKAEEKKMKDGHAEDDEAEERRRRRHRREREARHARRHGGGGSDDGRRSRGRSDSRAEDFDDYHGRQADEGLGRADELERGLGGWDRRSLEEYGRREDEEGRYYRPRDVSPPGYVYVYEDDDDYFDEGYRGRGGADERRRRPRPRRRSSDW